MTELVRVEPVIGTVVPHQPSAEDAAIDAWLTAQQSEHTRRSYAYAMKAWRDWLPSAAGSSPTSPDPPTKAPAASTPRNGATTS
jgi:hypothetical protein